MVSSEIDVYLEEQPLEKPKEIVQDDVEEEKRESLAILATLGDTKEYTGVQLALGDIKRLSPKDVEKYYNRYQSVLGKQVTGGLIETAIQSATRIISYMLPIDDPEKLCEDLQQDELVKRELSSAVGFLVLKGGRFVALASAISRVIKHVELGAPSTIKQAVITPVDTLESS